MDILLPPADGVYRAVSRQGIGVVEHSLEIQRQTADFLDDADDAGLDEVDILPDDLTVGVHFEG